ncbi:MAG: iron-siderophore ABC transporter substrate-binding protein [Nostoc sp. NMS7]|nr:iron-siderophore ABC transporter substrate-binding protein [Nostoc sp. NMS7]
MIIFPIWRISRRLKLWVVAMLTTFTIAACGGRVVQHPISKQLSPAIACQVISHEMGSTTVCGQPQKIVAIGTSMLELILSLDIQPAGFANRILFHLGDYDRPSTQIPYLGKLVTSQPINVGLDYKPSLEALLKIKPDLILGTEVNRNQYEILSKIAPTLLFKWLDTKTNLRVIAKAIGNPQKAEQIIAENDQRLRNAHKLFSPFVAAHPRVLMLTPDNHLIQNKLVTGSNSLCGSLVADLGFQLVYLSAANTKIPPLISIEILPQFNNADLIILLGYNFGQSNHLNEPNKFQDNQVNNLKQEWEKNAIAQSMQASKDGRVYFLPAYLCLGLPGPIGTELYLKELQKQLLLSP